MEQRKWGSEKKGSPRAGGKCETPHRNSPFCLASASPKEGMNWGAMTPFDISISPLASLGQATCSSCLLITVCLPGREHASQGDTRVHSAYRLLLLAAQSLNCHFGLCGSPAGAGMMSLCHSETESVSCLDKV